MNLKTKKIVAFIIGCFGVAFMTKALLDFYPTYKWIGWLVGVVLFILLVIYIDRQK